jgi:hypothetical protein
VLIILLVLGLAANIALVAGVAWLNYRATRRPPAATTEDPGAPVAADDTDPARLLALEAAPPAPDWEEAPGASMASPLRAEPELLSQPARRAVARRTPRSDDGATAGASGRRSRRFMMPDDGTSHARTERAIAAFLGEPVAPDPEGRSTRRRHRARRPAGAPLPRIDLVLSLAGANPDPRLVHALSAAIRGTVRSSDEVVEMPGGRLRVTLEADVGGGEAFVRRARAVVKPWLTALDPDLDLRVDRPRSRRSVSPS